VQDGGHGQPVVAMACQIPAASMFTFVSSAQFW
jgi:hypothetical protein